MAQLWIAAMLGVGIVGLGFTNAYFLLRLFIVLHLLSATGFLALRSAAFAASLARPLRQPPPAAMLPSIALLCPLYREPESLPHLVPALGRLDYPGRLLDIVIILEADDRETLAAMPRLEPPFRVVTVPAGDPRTKPRALNHALTGCTADIIGVYDAEDRPEPQQLRKVAAAFADAGAKLGCVQAQLNYHNRDDTLMTRMFALEYALQFDWFLPGLTRLGLPLPLGGTSNFVRRDALHAAGGWDAYNVTEDADLGIKLGSLGYDMQAIQSTTFEEATDTPIRWIKQRSRWLKGFLQTWLVHLRRPLGWREAMVLHFAVGAVFLSSVMNPLTWAAFLAWAWFGWEGLEPVFGGGFGNLCLALFLVGTSAHLWFTLSAPLRRSWFDLTTSFLFIPVYWVLQSVAGYKALYEFVVKPHYWDKTSHGQGAQIDPLTDHA